MKKSLLFVAGLLVMWCAPASAGIEQLKAYKGAFPESKPKCLFCHVDAIPKKDDGKHELNQYGQKVMTENSKPTTETYKKIGPVEEQTKK